MATARGYILETEETNTGHISKIAVQHGKDQTEEELRLIVENGGEISSSVLFFYGACYPSYKIPASASSCLIVFSICFSG